MGCCSSKTTAATTTTGAGKRAEEDEYAVLNQGGGRTGAAVHGTGKKGGTREPTLSEKRRTAAEAAEARQADWRQGGSTDPDKAKALRMRREKDELLARVLNRYHVLGKEAPIGLPSCNIDQLKRHLEALK